MDKQKPDSIATGEDAGPQESPSLLEKMQNGTSILETTWQLLMKLNILLLCDPAISSRFYLNEMEIYVYAKTCMWLLVTALLVLTPNWNNQEVL